MKYAILKFVRDEQGATAIEYGLIAGLIAAGIVATLTGLKDGLIGVFGRICTAIGATC